MPWREAVAPVRMERVAVVAPRQTLREVLVRLAATGVVEVEQVTPPSEVTPGAAARALQRLAAADAETAAARLALERPDVERLEREQAVALLAGEAQLEELADDALERGSVAALAGWAPAAELPRLAERLAEVGGAVVRLPRPVGTDPPTLLHEESGLHRSFAPLVTTYGTVPYADVDPTMLAGLAYVVMFGMMFGDVGHGALLLAAGLLLRAGHPGRLARYRAVWPFVVGAGLAAMFFGLLYGECFGPTGLVPVVWLAPLDEPVTLLGAALGVGAVLLCGAYVVGTVNRWREGGWVRALCAPSGLAGASAFLGLGLVTLGLVADVTWLAAAGAVVAAAGLTLAFVGLLAAAGGGSAGVVQAVVELFDAVLRLGTNVVSFARLAAFGLTHVALLTAVWDATTAFWGAGGAGYVLAVAVFVVGNVAAFSLEALVAGVQALRLEYYELFSRVFVDEGRPFRPWHLPVTPPLPERAS